MFRYSIVACARWETPYISEWISYYDLLGFDHIYLYCNDDDPAEMIAQVRATPTRDDDFVSVTHFRGQGQQKLMYQDAMTRVRRESEWVTFLDVDEFMVLRGVDSIHQFMRPHIPVADSVHFNWMVFGNSGFVTRPTGSVLRQYTHRADDIDMHTKHLSRSVFFSEDRLRAAGYPFWHGLTDPVWFGMRRINVLGADTATLLGDNRESASAYLRSPGIAEAMLGTAVINHYSIKSEDDFVLRSERGLEGQFSQQSVWKRSFEDGSFRSILRDRNKVQDLYLHDLSLQRLPETNVALRGYALTETKTQRVRIRHRLWEADVLLGEDGRALHAAHGTGGGYYRSGDVLHVRWDSYPAELFIKQDEVFVEAGARQAQMIDLHKKQTAELGRVRLPVAAIVLKVPHADHVVELRPDTSDVAVFGAIFLQQEYDRPDLGTMNGTILDLGANTGLSTAWFALRYPEARILALEPEAENFRILQRNTAALANVTALHAAIWPSDTTLRLRRSDPAGQPLGDWGYQTEPSAGPGDVIALSIPTLLQRYAIDVIDLAKIDIEGAEMDLFQPGATAWLDRTLRVVVETHERFRQGSDRMVSDRMRGDFEELEPSGENRIFIRRLPLGVPQGGIRVPSHAST